MIRLSNKDFKKLKPGQLLWYVEQYPNTKKIIRPFKYINYFVSHKQTFLPRKLIWYHLFNYELNLYENYESHWVNIPSYVRGVRGPVRNIQYFAKVTKKEEPEFITALMSL